MQLAQRDNRKLPASKSLARESFKGLNTFWCQGTIQRWIESSRQEECRCTRIFWDCGSYFGDGDWWCWRNFCFWGSAQSCGGQKRFCRKSYPSTSSWYGETYWTNKARKSIFEDRASVMTRVEKVLSADEDAVVFWPQRSIRALSRMPRTLHCW